jgi:hypothetical protein
MRGTGPVTIGRDVVYAYFTADGRAARVRVSADECDRLDLFAGRQVRVGLGGREPAVALVTAVVPAPPFAWVELELAAPAASRAG